MWDGSFMKVDAARYRYATDPKTRADDAEVSIWVDLWSPFLRLQLRAAAVWGSWLTSEQQSHEPVAQRLLLQLFLCHHSFIGPLLKVCLILPRSIFSIFIYLAFPNLEKLINSISWYWWRIIVSWKLLFLSWRDATSVNITRRSWQNSKDPEASIIRSVSNMSVSFSLI